MAASLFRNSTSSESALGLGAWGMLLVEIVVENVGSETQGALQWVAGSMEDGNLSTRSS